MKATARKKQPGGIKILRSVDRQGATYALDLDSVDRLREDYGKKLHIAPRIFIAHETASDYAEIRGALQPQIAAILTGLSEGEIEDLGLITFVDAVTEKPLASWRPDQP